MDKTVIGVRARLARMERGRGKRYTSELKKQVAKAAMRLREAGLGWHRIGRALGIPNETVRRFCRASSDSGGGAFAPVVVADDDSGTSVVLVTPGGYRVEGLNLDQVAQLLTRLAR
jgi:hypothetical protein